MMMFANLYFVARVIGQSIVSFSSSYVGTGTAQQSRYSAKSDIFIYYLGYFLLEELGAVIHRRH